MASSAFHQHHPCAYRCAKRGVAARPTGNVIWQKRSGRIINIVTQQPDSTPRGYIEGGVSSRDSYRSKFNLSGPIQDGLLYGSVTLLRQS